MKYDKKEIKTKVIIIDGKEVEVKIVPSGMHGEEWKPDPYYNQDSDTEEEEEIKQLKKDIIHEDEQNQTDEEANIADEYEKSIK